MQSAFLWAILCGLFLSFGLTELKPMKPNKRVQASSLIAIGIGLLAVFYGGSQGYDAFVLAGGFLLGLTLGVNVPGYVARKTGVPA